MLDRAGYADGDIDFGSNDLTRLPHLIVVGDIARVHGRTACAHGSTQLVSQRNDILLEGLAVLQCPAAGHDHLGGGEFRPFTLDDFRTDEAGKDRKSTRLNSSHSCASRMPYSACNKKPMHILDMTHNS